jgi:hypothetical protein
MHLSRPWIDSSTQFPYIFCQFSEGNQSESSTVSQQYMAAFVKGDIIYIYYDYISIDKGRLRSRGVIKATGESVARCPAYNLYIIRTRLNIRK